MGWLSGWTYRKKHLMASRGVLTWLLKKPEWFSKDHWEG